ncbi:MAG: hypothetical protein JEZ07_18940 [Phycisphaerae bacterium]|nr:hypothetical protein [Phycisphaerae bacterium]
MICFNLNTCSPVAQVCTSQPDAESYRDKACLVSFLPDAKSILVQPGSMPQAHPKHLPIARRILIQIKSKPIEMPVYYVGPAS